MHECNMIDLKLEHMFELVSEGYKEDRETIFRAGTGEK